MENIIVNGGLYLSYLLFVAALAGALVFPVIHLAGNPQKAKTSFAGLGLLLLVFGVGYAMSSSDVTPIYEKLGVGAAQSKLVGGGLITFYILAVVSVVAAVYAEIARLFK